MDEKPKPLTDDSHYARKCSYCGGTGYRTIGYKEPQEKECWYCNSNGWKIFKKPSNPKHTKPGQVERPVFVQTEYENEWFSTHWYRCPSAQDKYVEFRVKLKRYLLSRRGNKCQECGVDFKTQKIAKNNLYVHHIVFSRDGGTDEDENLILLCFDCHQKKHDYPITKLYVES